MIDVLAFKNAFFIKIIKNRNRCFYTYAKCHHTRVPYNKIILNRTYKTTLKYGPNIKHPTRHKSTKPTT